MKWNSECIVVFISKLEMKRNRCENVNNESEQSQKSHEKRENLEQKDGEIVRDANRLDGELEARRIATHRIGRRWATTISI